MQNFINLFSSSVSCRCFFFYLWLHVKHQSEATKVNMATNSFSCLYHEVWREPPTVYTFIISNQIYRYTIHFCFMTTWERVSYSKTTIGKIYVQTSLIGTFLLHSVSAWLLDINLEFIPSGYIFYISYFPSLWQHT